MKLPPDVEFHEDIRLLVHRPRGLLDEAVVNRVIAVLADLEVASTEPFDRFLDTVGVDAVELNFKYILHVSLFRRLAYGNRPPVKSAILTTDATIIHYARLHTLLTQGSSIHVRIFQDRNEAAWWLGVPVEKLVPETAFPEPRRGSIKLVRRQSLKTTRRSPIELLALSAGQRNTVNELHHENQTNINQQNN